MSIITDAAADCTLEDSSEQKLLVLHACRLRDEGLLKAGEIGQTLEELRSRVRLFASLDTLDSLARSGRIPKAVASIGALTQLKPLLTVNAAGSTVLCGKAFGRHRAVDGPANKIASLRRDDDYPVIPFCAHSSDNCRALIRKLNALGVAVDEKLLSALGPAIAGISGQGRTASHLLRHKPNMPPPFLCRRGFFSCLHYQKSGDVWNGRKDTENELQIAKLAYGNDTEHAKSKISFANLQKST